MWVIVLLALSFHKISAKILKRTRALAGGNYKFLAVVYEICILIEFLFSLALILVNTV